MWLLSEWQGLFNLINALQFNLIDKQHTALTAPAHSGTSDEYFFECIAYSIVNGREMSRMILFGHLKLTVEQGSNKMSSI